MRLGFRMFTNRNFYTTNISLYKEICYEVSTVWDPLITPSMSHNNFWGDLAELRGKMFAPF